VGLFEHFKETTDGADVPARDLEPVDLNDPIWQPIEGITLDKYAQLTAAMARQGLGTGDQAQAWLEAQGVKAGTWVDVQTGWVNRMANTEAVRTRYGILYSQS
jgi:hypothetical protein